MIRVPQKRAVERSGQVDSQADMLCAIQRALDLCNASQNAASDPVVVAEIEALQMLADAVCRQWPLDEEVKKRINIGPVAARNIADWNPGLANALMTVDYALRHDGVGVKDEDATLYANAADTLAA